MDGQSLPDDSWGSQYKQWPESRGGDSGCGDDTTRLKFIHHSDFNLSEMMRKLGLLLPVRLWEEHGTAGVSLGVLVRAHGVNSREMERQQGKSRSRVHGKPELLRLWASSWEPHPQKHTGPWRQLRLENLRCPQGNSFLKKMPVLLNKELQ